MGEAGLGVSLLSMRWLDVTQSQCAGKYVTRKQSEQGVSWVGYVRFKNCFD